MKKLILTLLTVTLLSNQIAGAEQSFEECLCKTYIAPQALTVLAQGLKTMKDKAPDRVKSWIPKIEKDGIFLNYFGTKGCVELVQKAAILAKGSKPKAQLYDVCDKLGELSQASAQTILNNILGPIAGVPVVGELVSDLLKQVINVIPQFVAGACMSQLVNVAVDKTCKLPTDMAAGAASIFTSSLGKCVGKKLAASFTPQNKWAYLAFNVPLIKSFNYYLLTAEKPVTLESLKESLNKSTISTEAASVSKQINALIKSDFIASMSDFVLGLKLKTALNECLADEKMVATLQAMIPLFNYKPGDPKPSVPPNPPAPPSDPVAPEIEDLL